MSTVIRGNNVIFRNEHAKQDITLKHSDPDYQLKFQSEVIFRKDTRHTTVTLGKYQMSIEEDLLTIKKDGKIAFKID